MATLVMYPPLALPLYHTTFYTSIYYPNRSANILLTTFTHIIGKSVDCYYCPNCTTHIYHHQAIMSDKVIVHTILLSDGKSMPPGGEIYGEGRLPWEKEVVFASKL